MKLSHIIIAALSITCAIIAASQYTAFTITEQTLLNSIIQGNSALAKNTLHRIDQRIALRIEQIHMLSINEQLQATLLDANREVESNPEPEIYKERNTQWILGQNEEFFQTIFQNPTSKYFQKIRADQEVSLEEIFATSIYGTIAATSSKTTDYLQNDEKWWQETLRKGVYISDVTYDLSSQVYGVEIAMPVKNIAPIGVIKAVIGIDEFAKLIEQTSALLPPDASVTLVNRHGEIIHSTGELFSMQKIPSPYLEDINRKETTARRNGMLINYAYSQPGTASEQIDWTIILERDEQAVFASEKKLKMTLLLLNSTAILSLITIGMILVASIARPIRKINKTVDEISKGNFKTTLPEKQPISELDELAKSLKRVLASLKIAIQRVGIPSEEIFAKFTKRTIQAEEARREAEESLMIYRKGFENSPNSHLVVDYADTTPRIIQVNKAFSKLYGYAPDEALGKNPNMLRSGRQTKEYYKKMWKDLLDPKIGKWTDEIVNKRKDGKPINVVLSISTIFDEAKKPRYFIAEHTDITKRVKANESRRKQ